MSRILTLAIVLALVPVAAFPQAGAPAAEEASPWSGKASLGYLSTSGNTNTTTYNTAFEVSYSLVKWTHTFGAAANGSDDNETTTAEAYQAGWKSAYAFSEHNYLFGLVGWRKDRFSGVTEQLSEAVGYGRRIIATPAHLLTAEIGAGNRNSDLSDGTSESGVIGTLGADYKWQWSETSNFEQGLGIESGSDNTFLESITAVRARMIGDLAIVFSYTVRHNTDVPAGSEKTDKFTAISLELAF
jgi:putative salt-induced outer membrane protein